MRQRFWVKNNFGWWLGFGFAVWAVLAQAQAATHVVINEIMADNNAAVAHAGAYPDWVELYNPTAQSVNLEGWGLTDNPATPKKFKFPSGTVISSKGFLVVWCDDATNQAGLHSGWTLKKAGDDVGLFNAATQRVDYVEFGFQLQDISLARSPDGAETFAPATPTPKAANLALPTGSPNQLKINEWMASSDGANWFELYNPGTQIVDLGGLHLSNTLTPTNDSSFSKVASWSFIGPGGFKQIYADWKTNPADHVYFSLSSSGGRLTIFASDGSNVYDRVVFGGQTKNISQGRLPDGGTNIVFFTVATPDDSNFQYLTNVVINEVLANADPPLEDAIELYNPTAAPIKIGSWWLSNSKDFPQKYRIPAGTTIPAGGYVVFYEFQLDPYSTGDSPYFSLSAQGDQVYLYSASNNAAGTLLGARAFQTFGASEPGVSFGRYINSQGKAHFVPVTRQTFGTSILPTDPPELLPQFRAGRGATNALPKVGPVVISEIMYHPPDLGTNDNVQDEYVKLVNITANAVRLYDNNGPYNGFYFDSNYGVYADGRTNTWRLRGGVDFNFPTNLTLAPGEALLLVSFNPAAEPVQLAGFRAKYGLGAQTRILGPYDGKLPNSGGSIELLKPGAPEKPGHADVGQASYIPVETIDYSDRAPWPAEADGKGMILERIKREAYGNDPVNWRGRSVLFLDLPQRDGNLLTLRFAGMAGNTYSVQFRADLKPGGGWTTLTNLAAQTNFGLRQISVSTTGAGKRFYRLVTPAQP